MKKKFDKGSKEWLMFMDFWNLCQLYWIVENTDEYWQALVTDASQFHEKYKEFSLGRELPCALVNAKEKEGKNERKEK